MEREHLKDCKLRCICDINHTDSLRRNAGGELIVGFYSALGRRLIPVMADWQKGTKGSMGCNLLNYY